MPHCEAGRERPWGVSLAQQWLDRCPSENCVSWGAAHASGGGLWYNDEADAKCLTCNWCSED